jgi:hypothetical protein
MRLRRSIFDPPRRNACRTLGAVMMKRVLVFAFGFFAIALLNGCGGSSTSGPTGSGWTGFDPENGKFTVAMPGTPAEKAMTESIGKRWVSTADGITYTVGYDQLRLPAGTADTDQAEQYMDNEVSTMQMLDTGKFSGEKKPLVVGGVPGREDDFELDGNKLRRIRMCVSGDRLYKVEITGPKDKVSSADADQYLESFRVSK